MLGHFKVGTRIYIWSLPVFIYCINTPRDRPKSIPDIFNNMSNIGKYMCDIFPLYGVTGFPKWGTVTPRVEPESPEETIKPTMNCYNMPRFNWPNKF